MPRAYALLLLVMLAAGGCHSTPATEATLPERLDALRANVLMVVLDAAAGRYFGHLGGTGDVTPSIDGLARDGVVFERAYSPGASTIVSVPALMTGLYPRTLVRTYGSARVSGATTRSLGDVLARWRKRGAATAPLLASAFHRAGFVTAAFSGNTFVSPQFGLAAGFDHFLNFRGTESGHDETPMLVGAVGAWFCQQGDARTFTYVHLMRPHSPYVAPREIAARFRPAGYAGSIGTDTQTLLGIDAGRQAVDAKDIAFLRSQYQANLFYADTMVAAIVRALVRCGLRERTVIVVTGDHGEAFREHGRLLHNTTVYNEMIRVPLVWTFPARVGVDPRRVTTPASLVDVAPTLEALFGLGRRSLPADGVSLVPSLLGTPRKPVPVYAEAMDALAVILGSHKLITSNTKPHPELYDLDADPREQTNVSAREPTVVAILTRATEGFRAKDSGDIDVTQAIRRAAPETLDRLRKLGYVHD